MVVFSVLMTAETRECKEEFVDTQGLAPSKAPQAQHLDK